MSLNGLRIGYVPYSPELSAPADRRRFPYFANRNKVPFEIADIEKEYDIILLTALTDLSIWVSYKRKHPQTRFIFEMVDSLILSSDFIRTVFKGPGRYFLRKESRFYFDYRSPILKWIKIADAVICSSEEIKKIISGKNKNVFISLDYMQGEVKKTKTDFSQQGKLKLVWEGQGVVLPHLSEFKDLFRKISPYCELHVITDESFPKFGNLIKNDTIKVLDKLPIETFFHKWEIYKNFEELTKFDCGIIPLHKKNKFGWHKPANKLISFWFCGMPTLTSGTPAYKLIMDEAGSDWYCSLEEEWIEKIKRCKAMTTSERESIASNSREFVLTHYSDGALDKIWYNVFDSVK